jgi:hypothetical protein
LFVCNLLFKALLLVSLKLLTVSYEMLHRESDGFFGMIKSWRIRLTGLVARMGAEVNTYLILVGNTEGKRPLRTPGLGWKYNIKMDIRYEGEGIAQSV